MMNAVSRAGRRQWWWWLSLLPFGLGCWASLVPGVRFGARRWIALGVLWPALAAAGWGLAAIGQSGSGAGDLSGALILLAWSGGVVSSVTIRRDLRHGADEVVPKSPQWPTPTRRSKSWSPRYALLGYAAIVALGVAVASALKLGLGSRVPTGAGVLGLDIILLGTLLPLSRRYGLSRSDLGLRAAPVAPAIRLAILALAAYGFIAVLWLLLVRPQAGVDALANVKHESTVNVVVAIIAVAGSAPIAEEIFFRGLLYRGLRNRMSLLPAALVAGALFGVVHITSYPLNTLPVKAAFGVIACLLYERTGSLLPGIAVHSFVDASALNLALTGNDVIALSSFCVLVVVLRALAWGRRRRTRRLRPHPNSLSLRSRL